MWRGVGRINLLVYTRSHMKQFQLSSKLEQLEFYFPERTAKCKRCEEFCGLIWSPTGSIAEDATPGWWLCKYCDKENKDYWEEMWDGYYGGLL
jgi:hypothetical protein